MQVAAIITTFAVTLVAVALAVRAAREIVSVVRLGQPAVGRALDPARRWRTMLTETLAHTRLLKWGVVGAAHLAVFFGFILLTALVATAYGQVFDPRFALPRIGHWLGFSWFVETLSGLTLIGITVLIVVRQRHHPRGHGKASRFYGSTFWQAYFVELVIAAVVACGLVLRGLEYVLAGEERLHFPLSFVIGELFSGASTTTVENLIFAVATIKICVSMGWLITLALNPTMGVAWHRFTAFPNVWFRREADGSPALGEVPVMHSEGQPIDFEDPSEDDIFGVGQVEHFTWKGLLDFTTCTECGRCQSQCPAWATDKPLSPKLLVMNLRDHAYAKAPYLLAAEEERAQLPEDVRAEAERPLVAPADQGGVIDPDVLWSCTMCGACVEQCPVDIEHVDHIVDMRRHLNLVEASFPSELNQLYKGLESKGNPWNMNSAARMDWAKDLGFDVPVVGESVTDLAEVDYLFWVGCAGAFEDRAKKTTRAVAELLHTAGVSFAVLGSAETCTGDPARRAGNEFVYHMLAQQNVETLHDVGAKTVIASCAHCFNTIGNEYPQLGLQVEVIHHTQLLNRLVREGRLRPAPAAGGDGRPITYHDPCYLGRHNQVYSPPRELLAELPGAQYREMPRNSERSFCCGAGGARMWMEESIGKRINVERTDEAVATGAERIATGCPFCKVMLSDGLTARQADGSAAPEVEVVDVAQLLLESVHRGADQAESADAGATEAEQAADPSGDAERS